MACMAHNHRSCHGHCSCQMWGPHHILCIEHIACGNCHVEHGKHIAYKETLKSQNLNNGVGGHNKNSRKLAVTTILVGW